MFVFRLRYLHGNRRLFHRLMPRLISLFPPIQMRSVAVTPVDNAVFKGSSQGEHSLMSAAVVMLECTFRQSQLQK